MKSHIVSEHLTADGSDPVLFEIGRGKDRVSVGIASILNCLDFAQSEEMVPPLPDEWWSEVKEKYDLLF